MKIVHHFNLDIGAPGGCTKAHIIGSKTTHELHEVTCEECQRIITEHEEIKFRAAAQEIVDRNPYKGSTYQDDLIVQVMQDTAHYSIAQVEAATAAVQRVVKILSSGGGLSELAYRARMITMQREIDSLKGGSEAWKYKEALLRLSVRLEAGTAYDLTAAKKIVAEALGKVS